MIPERELVSPMWCITAGAKERGKAEDIVRFFNWCFSEEGAFLYNYGIEGVSEITERNVNNIASSIDTRAEQIKRAVEVLDSEHLRTRVQSESTSRTAHFLGFQDLVFSRRS